MYINESNKYNQRRSQPKRATLTSATKTKHHTAAAATKTSSCNEPNVTITRINYKQFFSIAILKYLY
jgi:hypothetical protein